MGYSRADLTGINSNLVESRQGAITGVYLHLPVNGVVSVRPEVLFSVKGGQILTGITGSDDLALVDLELAYLELPVLGRLTLPRGRYRPAIFGGPSVGVQIGCDLLITPVSGGDEVNGTCGENVTGMRRVGLRLDRRRGDRDASRPGDTLVAGALYEGAAVGGGGPVELKNRGLAVLFGLTF